MDRFPARIDERSFFRSLFAAYPDALLLVDASGEIVLANPAAAERLRREMPAGPLVEAGALEHPESRLGGKQLADDRPGHEAVDRSAGGNRFEPRIDPRRKEHRRFASEIAERLDEALARNELASLVLVASNPFFGELNTELDDAVTRRVTATMNADLTACSVQEQERRLAEAHARA